MIGRKFKVLHVGTWVPRTKGGFDPVFKVGDVFEVVKTNVMEEKIKVIGATQVKLNGVVLDINDMNPNFWCFITHNMLYSVSYKNEFEEVFETEGETERLSNGKNGERLMESVSRIRNSVGSVVVTKPLEDRYNEWVVENMHIYDLFCKFTKEAIAAGVKRTSHWLIVNRIRWEVEIATKGLCDEDKEFKISNDYVAFLARDFIKDNPEHDGIFKLKQMKRV